jgi:hypothetical protein
VSAVRWFRSCYPSLDMNTRWYSLLVLVLDHRSCLSCVGRFVYPSAVETFPTFLHGSSFRSTGGHPSTHVGILSLSCYSTVPLSWGFWSTSFFTIGSFFRLASYVHSICRHVRITHPHDDARMRSRGCVSLWRLQPSDRTKYPIVKLFGAPSSPSTVIGQQFSQSHPYHIC